MSTSMIVALSALFILLALVIWYRLRMRISKAKFALSTVSAMVTCLLLLLTAVSTGFPAVMATAFLTGFGIRVQIPGQDAFSILVLTLLTGCICYFIYRFSSGAIQNWNAQPRVSESVLAEDLQQNHLLRLARAQLLS